MFECCCCLTTILSSRITIWSHVNTMAMIKYSKIITNYIKLNDTHTHTHAKWTTWKFVESWSEMFKWLPRIVTHVISPTECMSMRERAALSIVCHLPVHIHNIHNVSLQRFVAYCFWVGEISFGDEIQQLCFFSRVKF